MFVQNGWDNKKISKGLTPKVVSQYITSKGLVTVYEPGPCPEPGHWKSYGDRVEELVEEATNETSPYLKHV